MSLDSSSRKTILFATMAKDLLKLLRDLRTLKNAGDLDDEESLNNQEDRWRNKLGYPVLMSCLEHYDEEIRLEALALLVESKKSTQCFYLIELTMITMFLIYNMRERLEYVPLIKKALKRMKESLAVLRRNVAREEKIRECESQVDGSRELYEKLRAESIQVAEESRASIEMYKGFYLQFRQLWLEGIGPGSTHSHKRSSLQMLQLGQQFLDKEFEDCPWTKEQADKLFQCLLLDTYETNKEIIYKIARGIDPRLLRLDDVARVREIIDVALDLGNSIRPIDSITASYMLKISLLSPVIQDVLATYEGLGSSIPQMPDQTTLRLMTIVVERLRAPLRLAEENIVAAAGKHSLYGYLFCIRNLLGTCDLGKVSKDNEEAWTKMIAELVEISFRLNRVVSQIVNNSSPEGHFPMDTESTNALRTILPGSDDVATTVTPQMVLLCSWRTVKEVSLLFGELSAKSPIAGDKTDMGLLDEKQLIDIGEHLVTLLFETKHRGAFEQAHVGFGQLCTRLWRLKQRSLQKLPKLWLHHLLLAVSGLSPGNAKLCATRRSAGVPYMLQALVSSDPLVQSNATAAVFNSVMKILLGFTELEEGDDISSKTKSLMYEDTIFSDLEDSDGAAKSEEKFECPGDKANHETITEMKTHALNILRALFKHAQLGDLAKTYAADGLTAAMKSYDGKTWAERNAATLLFSALITRIFGVQRTKDHVNLTLHNRMTGRIFFERYPSLLPFMLNQLRAFVAASDTLIKPSVQFILLLLSRLYPSFNSDDADSKWKIDEFINLVSACAKSKVYKTRELAARALVPLLTDKTLHTFVVELFEKIAHGRSSGLSLNALHGYMLQILEIIKSPRFTTKELPQVHVDKFLADSRWIVENVESNNDRSACFPLATAYVTALRKFVKVGSKIEVLEKNDLLDRRLVGHLNLSRILKQRPGREIYELAVARLFVTVMEHRASAASDHESVIIAWNSILTHSNVQVQTAGWSGVAGVIEKSPKNKLINIAVSVGLKNIKAVLDPDLQDSVYEFFYTVFNKSGKDDAGPFDIDGLDESSLAIYIVTALVSRIQGSCFQETPSFFRLLGKAYGKLPPYHRDEYLTSDDKRSIYKTFLDNTWMGSADVGCRIAISLVMYELFIASPNSMDDQCLSLDWWTSLLNLLVDDNAQVRRYASIVVCKIPPFSGLACDHRIIINFLEKFVDTNMSPSVTFAALFAWSMTLSGDADYEMDDSDVFNKCYNYEMFEPLRIARLCDDEALVLPPPDDVELPLQVREWLAERLGTVDSDEFATTRQLVAQYGKTVPAIDDKLGAVVDPTHNDKLLQALAYKILQDSCRRLLDGDKAETNTVHNLDGDSD